MYRIFTWPVLEPAGSPQPDTASCVSFLVTVVIAIVIQMSEVFLFQTGVESQAAAWLPDLEAVSLA